MNDKDFGFDDIQPVEPITPFYNEPKEMNLQTQYTTEEPVQSSVTEHIMESTVNTPNYGNSYNEMPTVASQIPYVDEAIVENVPVIDDTVNENPNAKISLKKVEEVIPDSNLPREKMDRGTFWILVWLFIGLLAIIIALPYLYELI